MLLIKSKNSENGAMVLLVWSKLQYGSDGKNKWCAMFWGKFMIFRVNKRVS